MTPRFWTLLTGVDTVRPFFNKEQAESAAAEFVQSCDDERVVTIDNWREELAALNTEMDEAGEAHYLCILTEHEFPALRSVIMLDNGQFCRIDSDSSFLAGAQVAVLETNFNQRDYSPSDIMVIDTPEGPLECVGHLQSIRTPDWPIDTAYAAILRKDAAA